MDLDGESRRFFATLESLFQSRPSNGPAYSAPLTSYIREKDIVHVHHHSFAKPWNHFQIEILDVAANFQNVRGVNEQDVVLLKLSEFLDGQHPEPGRQFLAGRHTSLRDLRHKCKSSPDASGRVGAANRAWLAGGRWARYPFSGNFVRL
jgi:hypothetical protein